MTTVQITLSEQLAIEARRAGLFSPEKIEALLREELRNERLGRLQATRALLSEQPLPAMTPDEIQAEIDAYRAERARAVGA